MTTLVVLSVTFTNITKRDLRSTDVAIQLLCELSESTILSGITELVIFEEQQKQPIIGSRKHLYGL